MGPVDIILIVLIACAAFLALRSVIRKRKNGGCSCGCADCPSSKKSCCTGGKVQPSEESFASGGKTPPSEPGCPFCSQTGGQDQTSV